MKTELTREQSQHLIELGVDISMASRCGVPMEAFGRIVYHMVDSKDVCFEDGEKPIFTLTDLLELLPKEITYDEEYAYALDIQIDNGDWYAAYLSWYGCTINDNIQVENAPELIDALYNLLVWVIKNGYLKL